MTVATLASTATGGASASKSFRFDGEKLASTHRHTVTLATEAVTPYVPGPGSWRIGGVFPRSVHAWDLPGTGDEQLICAGSGNSVIWSDAKKYVCYRYDRESRALTTISTPNDWFCNGAIHMHDGKILVASGTAAYPLRNGGKWAGTSTSYTYDPESGAIDRLGDVIPAWYPGLLEDQVGNIYKHGGIHNGTLVDAWEYLPVGSRNWQRLPWIWKTRNYSDIRLVGNSLGAYTGASSWPSVGAKASLLNLTTGKRTLTPGLRQPLLRKAAASVMLYPAQDKRLLVIGGGDSKTTTIRDVDMIDYSVWPQQVPSFVPKAPLPTGMQLLLAITLPNGQLFVTGGNTAWRTGSVIWAAIYDPFTDAWVNVAPPTIPRNYHSTIMAGLDGEVSTFGGNPANNKYEDREEIYSPWYMTRQRPSITTTALPDMTYGGSYPVDVQLPPDSTLGYFTLDRARADTHTTVPNQLMANVPFTRDAAGSVTLHVPNDPALLPPGDYKLAAVTSDRVPSIQVWVHIS